MQYLITLKNDLISAFDGLTPDKVSLFIVNGEMAKTSNNVSYIARFLLLDCRLPNPFAVVGYIKHWFESHNLTVPDLNFSSEVIDLETYDLEIDLGLTDKLIISDNGKQVQICYSPVWSERLGTFIKGGIAVDV